MRGFAQGLTLDTLAAYYLNYARRGKVLQVLEALREGLRDRAEKHARSDLAEVLGSSARAWPRRGAAVLAAVDQLERLGEPRPSLAQAPARWLPKPLARKLPPGRFPDFDTLYQAIEDSGYYWWRDIGGLGQTTARAVVAWLAAREAALGRELPKISRERPKRARVPVWATSAKVASRGDPASALVPLSRGV